MDAPLAISDAVEEVCRLYAEAPSKAETTIETALSLRLEGVDKAARLDFLTRLIARFEPVDAGMGEDVLHDAFELLMGRSLSSGGLTSEEMLKRLSDSLNTVFDSLNKLIANIDMTLLGESRMDETIRKVIGFHVEGDETAIASLETYLDHIKRAFQVAHEASKGTARKIVEDVLQELDPVEVETSAGISKLDPRRRAKIFNQYEERYRRCKAWFESDRFVTDFLREFENSVRNLT